MNKIINWTFGSFFRTIGRIIAFIVLGALLTYVLQKLNINIWQVLDVQANTINTDGWFWNSKRIEGAKFYNWTSATNYSELTITYGYKDLSILSDDNTGEYTNVGYEYAYKNGINPGSNGITFGIKTGTQFYHYYLYSVVAYIGGTKALSRYSSSSFIVGNAPNDSMDYSYITLQTVDCSYFSGDYNYCYAVYGIVQPSYTGFFLYPRLTGSSTGDFAVLGYDLEVLGSLNYATKTDVTNAINNSGLATANSVTAVQNSINQVQQEIQGTQDAIDEQTQQQQENHEETMNTITDDSINENGVSDFTDGLNKEYSSLTPFSDFLNLPLTWIQSLLASGQSCTTIHLPLPYLDNKYLDLPCMTEFWQQMGAVGNLVQLVWIAIVGVRIFNGLFLLTCETIDPNPDKDMTKLRTWEL